MLKISKQNIDTQYFFVKDYLMKELFALNHVSGKQNVSDMLTKVVTLDKLKY